MSQKKVDYYKEQKANRKKIIRREKRILRLEQCFAALVAIGLAAWIGFSIYGKAEEVARKSRVAVNTEIDVAALNDYISGLSADTEEIEDEELTAEESEEDVLLDETADSEETAAEEAAAGESVEDVEEETQAEESAGK